MLVVVAPSAAAAQAPAKVEPVIVSLRAEANVEAEVVRLSDVAYLYGGDTKLREAMIRLDLADTRQAAGHVLSRDAILFRLLLAGHAAADFRITGAGQTLVRGPAQGRSNVTEPRARAGTAPAAPSPTRPGDPPADDRPIVVKSRDRVRMIVHLGPVNVVAAGEALQDGRSGQSIRIRNVDSNKTVQGRVLGPGVVEVEY
jgi:hypothetical protein